MDAGTEGHGHYSAVRNHLRTIQNWDQTEGTDVKNIALRTMIRKTFRTDSETVWALVNGFAASAWRLQPATRLPAKAQLRVRDDAFVE